MHTSWKSTDDKANGRTTRARFSHLGNPWKKLLFARWGNLSPLLSLCAFSLFTLNTIYFQHQFTLSGALTLQKSSVSFIEIIYSCSVLSFVRSCGSLIGGTYQQVTPVHSALHFNNLCFKQYPNSKRIYIKLGPASHLHVQQYTTDSSRIFTLIKYHDLLF